MLLSFCTALCARIRRTTVLTVFSAGLLTTTLSASAQTINVRDYGVTTSGDQTSRISNLIKNNPGKTLYFPQGTYYVSTLTITNSIVLSGASGAVLAPYSSSSTAGRMIDIRKGAVTIKGLTINGGSKRSVGIYISNTSETMMIDHCVVTNISGNSSVPGYGIQVNKNTGHVTIQYTTISNITGYSDGVVGNLIGANRGVYINNVNYITIAYCTFGRAWGYEDGDCIQYYRWDGGYANSVIIKNNTFQNICKRAVKIHGNNTTIINNVINGLQNGTNANYAAISIYSSNNNISGNKITLYRSFCGIEVTSGVTNGKVTNNKLSSNSIKISYFSNKYFLSPIIVQNLSATTISANTFNGSSISMNTAN